MVLQPPKFVRDLSSLLRLTCQLLISCPVILVPFLYTAFLQLFVLEFLYFIPQYPSDFFFAPIVQKLWGEEYLHYPTNFYLLPQLFQNVLIPINILIGSFFTAMSVGVVLTINNGEAIHLKRIAKDVSKQYVHILIAATLAFLLLFVLLKGYGLIYGRGVMIRSSEGIFYLIKKLVVGGSFYFAFVISVLSTTLMAYLYPIILAEKKKVHVAVWLNFKLVWATFWKAFITVFVFSLLFIPVHVLKLKIAAGALAPDWTFIMLILDVLMMMVINALIYTALTTIYLSEREGA